MGYGQYTEGTRHYYPDVPRPGRRTKAEILAGAPGDYVKAWKSAHNEVTRVNRAGDKIVRLIETDILKVFGPQFGRRFELDNGGWYTPTTAQHMSAALAAHGFPFHIWNAAKRRGLMCPGGNSHMVGDPGMVLCNGSTGKRVRFQRRIMVYCDQAGQWIAEPDVGWCVTI